VICNAQSSGSCMLTQGNARESTHSRLACDGAGCRYLYVGTSSGSMLVIDQEAGEDKALRLVQMTPRLTANRGLLTRPPAPCAPPCSPSPAPHKCACFLAANDRGLSRRRQDNRHHRCALRWGGSGQGGGSRHQPWACLFLDAFCLIFSKHRPHAPRSLRRSIPPPLSVLPSECADGRYMNRVKRERGAGGFIDCL